MPGFAKLMKTKQAQDDKQRLTAVRMMYICLAALNEPARHPSSEGWTTRAVGLMHSNHAANLSAMCSPVWQSNRASKLISLSTAPFLMAQGKIEHA